MKHTTRAALFALLLSGSSLLVAQRFDTNAADAAATSTTVTNVTGTISQVNYGRGGEVHGFLIGTNTLLEFDHNVTGGVASLGAAGNSVTYSGTAYTATSGFTAVRVSSFTNNTTKAAYTAPSTSTTATAYGPVSGVVKQLNYSGDGSIDGFVFTPAASSTSVFVGTGRSAATTLAPLLTVGATVSVTGTVMPAFTPACATATASALTAVDATSLTIGSQTIVISSGGGGDGGGPGGRGGHH